MPGLSGSERAGTTDIKALDVGQVPADAWEFEPPASSATPLLGVRSPWKLAFAMRWLTKSASFSVVRGNNYAVSTGTGGAGDVVATLPALTGNNGRVLFVKTDSGTNKLIPTRSGSDKIGAKLTATTFELYAQGDWVELEDVGSFWSIVGFGFNEIAYTPTLTGFGTATSVGFSFVRVGNRMKVRGKFTAGTTTATEARISLPGSLVSDSGIIASIEIAGVIGTSTSASGGYYATIESGVGYLTVSLSDVTHNPLAKLNANSFVAAGTVVTIMGDIPISGWNG